MCFINKKHAILFLLFILFLFAPTTVFSSYFKYQNNPLHIDYGIHQKIFQANVYKEGSQIKGLFSTNQNNSNYYISIGESKKGIDWLLKESIYNDGSDLYAPRILTTGQKQLLFFTKKLSDSHLSTFLIECDLNFECDSNITEIISPVYNTWKSKDTASMFPLFENNRYFVLFSASNGYRWSIGLAYSDDMVTWTECPNNPILLSSDGPFVFTKNGTHHLYYHAVGGIYHRQTNDPFSCNMTWSPQEQVVAMGDAYDYLHAVSPSVIEIDNILYLFYSGRNPSGWTLNLATSEPIPDPSPQKYVIIPGLFSSWNRDAVLYNKSVSPSEWVLNPIIDDYNGLLQTLQNLGYKENTDYYFFPYNWKQPVLSTASDLNSFITTISDDSPDIYLIGHSLGGIVSRVYQQKYNNASVKQILTLGSPHQGTAGIYKALSAGDFDRSDSASWIAQKILLHSYKNSPLTPNKEIISTHLPVLYDLIPTYPFLFLNNQPIPPHDMVLTNHLLNEYNPAIGSLDKILSSLSGSKGDTLAGYNIKKQTIIDKLMHIYEDGHPTDKIYELGDRTITLASSSLNTNTTLTDFDHGEIVYKKEAIGAILTKLGIPHTSGDIIEGNTTDIFPSIFFLLLSPAKLEVTFNSDTYFPNEGIVYIPNPQQGEYVANISGIESGAYKLIIGQNGADSDLWKVYEGNVPQDNPTDYRATYTIQFEPADLSDPLSIDELYNELITYLKKSKAPSIQTSQNLIKKSYTAYRAHKYKQAESYLIKGYTSIHRNLKYELQYSLYPLDLIENLYPKLPVNSKLKKDLLSRTLKMYEFRYQALSYKSNVLKRFGSNTNIPLVTFVGTYISDTQSLLQENNLQKVFLRLKTLNALLNLL